MSVTVKAAWIGVGGLVFVTLISIMGDFLIKPTSPPDQVVNNGCV